MAFEGSALDDFGRPENRDIISPITILTILIAFTIPLFSKGLSNIGNLDISLPLIFGAMSLIFFMLYTVDYYEKIWADFYSLPSDIAFFRIYCLVVGVIVISLMETHPKGWMWYLCFLFFVMTAKKWSTRSKYLRAVDKQFADFKQAPRKVQCLFYLAKNMSYNFLVLGFLLSAAVSAVLTYLLFNGVGKFETTLFGQPIVGSTYSIVGAIYSFVLVWFWHKKIRSGLSFIRRSIDSENVEYFSQDNSL